MKPTLLPVMALIAIMTFSCSSDSIEDNKIESVVSSYVPQTKTIEIEIMDLINAHRASIGLNSLECMSTIKAEAFTHTDYMVENKEVSHANFYQRKANLISSTNAVKVAENVAYGFSMPTSVVNAWLNSPGHKEVIEGDYTNFEISAEQDDSGRWYYTNIFVKR